MRYTHSFSETSQALYTYMYIVAGSYRGRAPGPRLLLALDLLALGPAAIWVRVIEV